MSNATLQRVRREKARKEGRCIYCFKAEASPSRQSCADCRARIAAWVKNDRAAKKGAANGRLRPRRGQPDRPLDRGVPPGDTRRRDPVAVGHQGIRLLTEALG